MEAIREFNAIRLEEKKEKPVRAFNAFRLKKNKNIIETGIRKFEANKIPEPTDYLDKWYYVVKVARQRVDNGEPIPVIVKDLQNVDTRGFVLMINSTHHKKYDRVSEDAYKRIREIVCDLSYVFDYLHQKSVGLPISNDEYSNFIGKVQEMFLLQSKDKLYYKNKIHFITNKEGLITEYFKKKPKNKYAPGSKIHLQTDTLTYFCLPGKMYKPFEQVKSISCRYQIFNDISSREELSFEENLDEGNIWEEYCENYKDVSVVEFFKMYSDNLTFFYKISRSFSNEGSLLQDLYSDIKLTLKNGKMITIDFKEFYDNYLAGLF